MNFKGLALYGIPSGGMRSNHDLDIVGAAADQNLTQAQLPLADSAAQTAQRKVIYLELHPETARGCDRRQTDSLSVCSFAEATAGAVGKSERSVIRDAARGEAIALLSVRHANRQLARPLSD
jgi:hypothetical protein